MLGPRAASTVNIFSSHLLSIFNNVSVWWHVVGATVIVIILWVFLKPGATHWSATDVFTYRVTTTGGMFNGSTDGFGFWFSLGGNAAERAFDDVTQWAGQ